MRTITLTAEDADLIRSALYEAIEGRHPENYDCDNPKINRAIIRDFKAALKRLEKKLKE